MDGDARGIGEGIEESRRGSLILSRGSSPARGFGGDQPPVATGSGEQRTDRGGGVGRLGWVDGQLGRGPAGRGVFSLFPFFSGICFLFSFYLFISFFVLFHLKVFRHFIKMCFLHHNYQCII